MTSFTTIINGRHWELGEMSYPEYKRKEQLIKIYEMGRQISLSVFLNFSIVENKKHKLRVSMKPNQDILPPDDDLEGFRFDWELTRPINRRDYSLDIVKNKKEETAKEYPASYGSDLIRLFWEYETYLMPFLFSTISEGQKVKIAGWRKVYKNILEPIHPAIETLWEIIMKREPFFFLDNEIRERSMDYLDSVFGKAIDGGLKDRGLIDG